MKIFAISDIHGDSGLLQEAIEKAQDADYFIYCGDMASTLNSDQKAEADEFMDAFFELQMMDVEPFFIKGNIDALDFQGWSYYLDEPFEEFVPFEYIAMTPFGTNNELPEEKLAEELEKLGDCKGKIIVAHCPPYGVCDEIPSGAHVGSTAIRDWIEKMQPKIWLCGHIHEAYGEGEIGETKVYNVARTGREIIV